MTPNLPTSYGVSLEVFSRYLKLLYDADWEDERGVIQAPLAVTLWRLGEKDTVRVTPLFRRSIGFSAMPSVRNN